MKADSLFKDDCHSSLNCLPSIIIEFYYCRKTKAKDKLNSLKQKENKGRKTSKQQKVSLMTREQSDFHASNNLKGAPKIRLIHWTKIQMCLYSATGLGYCGSRCGEMGLWALEQTTFCCLTRGSEGSTWGLMPTQKSCWAEKEGDSWVGGISKRCRHSPNQFLITSAGSLGKSCSFSVFSWY